MKTAAPTTSRSSTLLEGRHRRRRRVEAARFVRRARRARRVGRVGAGTRGNYLSFSAALIMKPRAETAADLDDDEDRGDVGSWVREAAMESLLEYLLLSSQLRDGASKQHHRSSPPPRRSRRAALPTGE